MGVISAAVPALSAAAAPTPRSSSGGGGMMVYPGGISDGAQSAPTGLAAAFAIIRFLAERLSSFDRFVYDRSDRTRAPLHPPEFEHVWGAPTRSREDPANPMWLAVFATVVAWGEAFIWKNRVGRTVLGLSLLHPSRVTDVQRTPTGPRYQLDDDRSVSYGRDEIVHVIGMTFDGVRGVPPVRAAVSAHQIALMQERQHSGFLRRGTAPSGVLSGIPDNASEEFVSELRSMWRDQMAGVSNAGEVVMLKGALDWSPISVPPAEAQLLQSRQFSREELLSIYAPGLPHHLLGWKSNTSNFGTGIDAQNRHLLGHVFAPRLAQVVDPVSAALLPPHLRLGFDTSGMQVASPKDQSDVWRSARLSGVVTRDEYRQHLGLGPLAGPDNVTSPTNVDTIPVG